MVNWEITVDGTELQDIFNVNYNVGESDKLGKATIECSNNANNRNFTSGDEIIIKKNGEKDFRGFLTGKPTKAGANATNLEIQAKDSRLELQYEQVGRVFYNMDTGAMIREALNSRVEPKNKQYIFYGNFIDDWTSETPEFELGDISAQDISQAGVDFIFLGWHEGAGIEQSVYEVTYHNVPDRAIPGDGSIDRFFTRLLVNNRGQQFQAEVNLRDNHGNNYNWDLNLRGSDFQEYELNAEDATSEASIGSPLSENGTLQYRFSIDGKLPEARGAAIDYASTIPFDTTPRNSTLKDTGVEDTGNVITRRVDRSLFEMITELSTEDGYISYADVDNILHYEQSGQQSSPDAIDYDTTPVVGAEFDRDYENITNKVVVQGTGDVRVTLTDDASIQYYGVSPREEPLVDDSIQSRPEAIRRGRGFLKKNAWDDVAFTFEIGDASFNKLNIGDDINVNWPPEDIEGIYAVSQIETDNDGIVTVGITDTEAI